jgi:threonine/homoserine/homoserine lactone efflux protein
MNFIEPVIAGISLGLVLAMLIGPVFFILLNTSLKKGFVPAAYLALGVMLSDALFITIAYFGSAFIVTLQARKEWIGIGGGLLLIVFGLVNLFKRPAKSDENMELPDDSKTLWIDTGKGFMMNTLNPFVLLFWMGVAGTLAVKDHYTTSHAIAFFLATLSTIFSTDLLKAWLAVQLKSVISDHFLLWLNRLSGIGLIIFGLRMLYLMCIE